MSEENVVWLLTGLFVGGILGAGMQFLNQQLGNSHHSLRSFGPYPSSTSANGQDTYTASGEIHYG